MWDWEGIGRVVWSSNSVDAPGIYSGQGENTGHQWGDSGWSTAIQSVDGTSWWAPQKKKNGEDGVEDGNQNGTQNLGYDRALSIDNNKVKGMAVAVSGWVF